MRTVLLVAEKPSIASAIAKHLAGSSASLSREGRAQVWSFEHQHRGAPCRFLSTAVAGHLFSLDFTPEFNKFDIDPERLFDEGNVRAVLTDAGKGLVNPLRALSASADELVLCLDDDREGENICFEVLSIVKGSLKKGCTISRARFSAVTPSEVRRALGALDTPQKALSDAVEARQEIDLKVGVAFTRFQTRHFHDKFADLDSAVISFGPCQTPTLGFCVARQDAITNFRPRPFYGVSCSISGNVPAASLSLLWKGQPELDRAPIEALVSTLSTASGMVLRKEDEKTHTYPRPIAMNTVQMLKDASTTLGMSPSEALAVAERLYINGYMSYPRTESTSYPPSMDLRTIVSALQAAPSPQIQAQARRLVSGEVPLAQPRKGTDAGDHPPITPTELIPQGLAGGEQALYNMVARHFLATLSPDAQAVRRTLFFSPVWEKAGGPSVENPNFQFAATFGEYTVLGWKALYGSSRASGGTFGPSGVGDGEDDADSEASADVDELSGAGLGLAGRRRPMMPSRAVAGFGASATRQLTYQEVKASLAVGAPLRLASLGLYEGTTQPPEPLTEAALLSLMEKHGIGTDASMATHIENIVSRRYVSLEVRGRARRMIPTSLGISLAHGYGLIDQDLVSPFLRSSIEKAVTSVAEGRIKKEELVRTVLRKFRVKFLNFRDAIGQMDALFDAKFTSVKEAGRPFVACGSCHRFTSLISREPARLYCKTCDEIFHLPQRAKIVEVCGKKCPCGWPLLCASYGSKEKHVMFCPRCYTGCSEPELLRLYQERSRGMGRPVSFGAVQGITCATCLRDCPFSLHTRGLGRCPACAGEERNDIASLGGPAGGSAMTSGSLVEGRGFPAPPAPSSGSTPQQNAPVRISLAPSKHRVTITIAGRVAGGTAPHGSAGDVEEVAGPIASSLKARASGMAPASASASGAGSAPVSATASFPGSECRPPLAGDLLPGYLYADSMSLPGFPQVSCTRCQYMLALQRGTVDVLNVPCQRCGRRTVLYVPARTGSDQAAVELRGCLFCDPEFDPYVEERESASVHQDVRRWRRGHAGGRRGKGGPGKGGRPSHGGRR